MDNKQGQLHPINDTFRRISGIFVDMGFTIARGPEIEDEWHNFDALNVPPEHPARDLQDTFWIRNKDAEKLKEATDLYRDEPLVLRTHTSSVQIRFMEEHKPPFKMIAPGPAFRNEATDATHEAQFHQLEGLVVGENISLAHLKGTLAEFLRQLYGPDVEFRFRPGYFPFVEPGVEVDLRFKGKWLEMLGAGMVHPNVLKSVNIDPDQYSGFAFGIGVDRLAMMKYGIDDVRLFYNGDMRLHNCLT